MDDSGRHVETPLHAAGKVLGQLSGPVVERGPLQAPVHRFRELAAGETVIPAKGGQILPARETGIESQFLRNPAQSRAGIQGTGPRSEDRDASRVGKDAAHDDADQCALAGSVWTQQSQAFAAAQFNRDSIDGRYLSKAFDQRNHLERDRFEEARRGL